MVARKTKSRTTTGPHGTDGTPPSLRRNGFDESAKRLVYGQWRQGVSVAVLAQQSGRSQTAIVRGINEVRAERILEQKLDFIFDPSFEAGDANAIILAPMPEAPRSASRSRPPAALLPGYLASLYDVPLLSREQEAHLFRKMNYLKFLAGKLRETIDPARARTADLDEVERLQTEAHTIKNQIIRANLRLVVSIAKKRSGVSNNFFELVSDGNISLMQAVEKFDFSLGFKFSTYASWAVIKNFARTLPKEKSLRDRFVTGQDLVFEATADHRAASYEFESDNHRNEETVQSMLGRLNDRERRILIGRYGIGGADELTLERLGHELGITKERVRQIESRAQEKLRRFVPKASLR
ncbi:RNA polymerase primary sigma factor [Singulisphaera sp. GP187]|uniref:sigma-70 family RNA polymerase sigma factor n=1 Tax=Singulisphaera sp. GP187 TaxID=1882752 RepID=UPI00092ABE2F|nr:sigma-70 family RNA polymerase sigma factor [Singulisphaera sp. GP187]SIN73947.1 RNA polymerase primary sigma factor [Singulisphaera sp. GP187]